MMGLVAILSLAIITQSRSLSKLELLNLKFEQKTGSQIPLDLSFLDEDSQSVRLTQYLGSRPVILLLGYLQCPMLCNLELNGAVECFQQLHASAGDDFEVLFISINPQETPALAAAKKQTYIKRYARRGSDRGWHFLVGHEPEIRKLAQTVGFEYAYDSQLKQYAHPSGMVVLTPKGKISRYLFGVSYSATELNNALKEATANRTESPVREILLLCFQHMPLVGKNSPPVMSAVRAGALGTVIGLTAYILFSVYRERRQNDPESSTRERA